MRVGVVGCGTGGRATAALLARAGHEVELLEQAPDPGPAGAGVLLQPTGLAVLDRLGVLAEVRAGAEAVHRVHGTDASWRTIMDLRYADLDPALHALGTHRGVLFAALHGALARAGVPVRPGVRVTGRRGPLLLDGAGGEHGPLDLVVAADGARSALRDWVPGRRRERTYAWGALWTIVPDPDGRCAGVLDQVFDGTHRLLGLLPLGTPPHLGARVASLFWSVRSDRIDAVRAAGLDALKAQMTALAPHAAPLLDGLDDIGALTPAVYRHMRLRRRHGPGIALVGDRAAMAWPRDHLIGPAGRIPQLRRLMLETLAGRVFSG